MCKLYNITFFVNNLISLIEFILTFSISDKKNNYFKSNKHNK